MRIKTYLFIIIVAFVASVVAYSIIRKAYADMETIDLDQFEGGAMIEDVSVADEEVEL